MNKESSKPTFQLMFNGRMIDMMTTGQLKGMLKRLDSKGSVNEERRFKLLDQARDIALDAIEERIRRSADVDDESMIASTIFEGEKYNSLLSKE